MEASLQTGLIEFQRLVERTIEIKFQRDLVLIEAAHLGLAAPVTNAAGQVPADPIEFDTDGLANRQANLRDSFISSGVHDARLASESDLAGLKGLNAVTAAKAIQLLALARAEGIQLKVIAGHISIEKQRRIFGLRKQLLPFSTHSSGLAFDVAVVKDGRIGYGPSKELNRAGAIGRALGLKWGGDFSRDQAWSHFELSGVQD